MIKFRQTKTLAAINASIVADSSRAATAIVTCKGTSFTGHTISFEVSHDGVTWCSISGTRTQGTNAIENSATITSAPVYSWRIPVLGWAYFRAICVAHSSGSPIYTVVLDDAPTDSLPLPAPATATPYTATNYSSLNVCSTANTNLVNCKSTAALLTSALFTNTGASTVYLKLYSKSSAPVLASDTPWLVVPIAAGAHVALGCGSGIKFTSGLAYAITGAVAFTDTTAIAANQVTGILTWV